MKLLVDAQLPRRMVGWLAHEESDIIHTLDLADGNRTSDETIVELADREGRVVVSKDADFVNSHLLFGRPAKLLLISTGNISNSELERLVSLVLLELIQKFQTHDFLELSHAGVIIRD